MIIIYIVPLQIIYVLNLQYVPQTCGPLAIAEPLLSTIFRLFDTTNANIMHIGLTHSMKRCKHLTNDTIKKSSVNSVNNNIQ